MNIKKYILPISFLFLGALSGIMYQLIGSYVNSEGMLIEPFYLIPLAYIFLFISFVSFLVIKGKEILYSN